MCAAQPRLAGDMASQPCMLHAIAERHRARGHQAGAEAAVPDLAPSQRHHQAGTRY